jgi:hypothetical protein
MSRLRRGRIHGGVRWKTWSWETFGWISGTNWIAEAPVPTTATLRPSSSAPWSHFAEWNAGPSKRSSPGSFGVAGSLRAPAAPTRTSAVMVPFEVSMRHRCPSSSQAAFFTACSKRMCGRMP